MEPTATVNPPRPSTWAEPLSGVPGFSNLFRVSPTLYRAQQPEKRGIQYIGDGHPLESGAEPIRTVVSLRAFHDEDGDALGKSSVVRYERIKFNTWHPEEEDVVKFLRIATTPSCQPVLVHCEHGSDRTGMMVAVYRVVVEGWTKDAALKEMTEGGFGFHSMWKDVQAYVKEMDVDGLKAKVAALGPWK